MKTYQIHYPPGQPPRHIRAASLGEAKRLADVPAGEFPAWGVIPTARQIRKTKSLLRGI